MKKLLALTILLSLGMGTAVFADSINTVISSTTPGAGRITATVFNDSGAAINSGAPVVWDHDDTEYDGNGYPYVTTTTTADDPYTAGVMLTNSCPDQQLCEIITRGWAPTRVTVATLSEDTIVGTSTTASSIGDSGELTNGCHLGTLIAYTSTEDATASAAGRACVSGQLCHVPVQVNITCGQ